MQPAHGSSRATCCPAMPFAPPRDAEDNIRACRLPPASRIPAGLLPTFALRAFAPRWPRWQLLKYLGAEERQLASTTLVDNAEAGRHRLSISPLRWFSTHHAQA